MFPGFRQRLLMLAGIAVGGWVYLLTVPAARAADGTEGFTLLLAGSPVTAIGAVVLATVAAVAIGGVVGAWGNPLAGVFTLAAALGCAAGAGGTIDGWLRSAASSGGYMLWAAESVMWAVLIAAGSSGCVALSARLRTLLDIREKDDTLEAPPADIPERRHSRAPKEASKAFASFIALTRKSSPSMQTAGATMVAIVLGSILTVLLVPTPDVWQVTWGLAIAYAAAGVAAHQLFPLAHPLAILLSPLAAAAVSYTGIALFGGGAADLLHDHYTGRLWHPGLALPVHYASAGVAGAVVGIVWSQVLGWDPGAPAADQAPAADHRRAGSADAHS